MLFGVKKAPITFKIDGKVRSGSIPGVLSMSVRPLPSVVEGQEIYALIKAVSIDRRSVGYA